TPSISGTLGPYASASSRPTRRSRRARASARFTLTVDLPTPPLPLPTTRILPTPSTRARLPSRRCHIILLSTTPPALGTPSRPWPYAAQVSRVVRAGDQVVFAAKTGEDLSRGPFLDSTDEPFSKSYRFMPKHTTCLVPVASVCSETDRTRRVRRAEG